LVGFSGNSAMTAWPFETLFAAKGESTDAQVSFDHRVFAVGFLKIFSILFRPISISFDFTGNIFAGKHAEAMSNLVPTSVAAADTVLSWNFWSG